MWLEPWISRGHSKAQGKHESAAHHYLKNNKQGPRLPEEEHRCLSLCEWWYITLGRGIIKIKELVSHLLSSGELYGNSGTHSSSCFNKCASLVASCDSSPSPTNLHRTILDLNNWEEPYRVFIEGCPADEGMVMQRWSNHTKDTEPLRGWALNQNLGPPLS